MGGQQVKRFWCLLFSVWPIIAVGAFVIAPWMNWWFPGESYSPLGRRIDDLFYLVLAIVTIVYIGTQVALGYVLWRGANPDRPRALFTHGSHTLETIWTIVPAGILLFISLYQMDVWAHYRIKSFFPEEAASDPVAEVTARQFEWRIRYPAPGKKLQLEPQPDDLYAVNDLHVPSGRPVMIRLRSGDVQHSFFVPELRVKQDAVPGEVIPVWFEAVQSREYALLCAELCGWGHYKMRARVTAEPEEKFRAYLRALKREQNDDGVSGSADAQTSDEVAQ